MTPSSVRHEVDGTVTVTPVGQLDLAASHDLRAALVEACEVGGPVVVDLQDVTFVDSSALGVLVSAHKRLRSSGCNLSLVHASERVSAVLRITGLVNLLDVQQA